MLKRQTQIIVGIALALLVVMASMQGCGKISGGFTANQNPTVQIVNVPQNAADSTLTQQTAMPIKVAAYDKPITILSMQGTTMERGSEKVYLSDPGAPFLAGVAYYMAYDTSWVDTLGTGQIVIRNAQAALVAISGGNIPLNTDCFIDFRFNIINFYVFSYAPILHWVGFDADGFVDHYRYADIIDTTFINGFKAAEDNGTQYAFLTSNAALITWVDTTAMQARVYLRTTAGDTTEHLFLVKSVDNIGAESQSDYKTFYRSNRRPNNPQIKPMASAETEFTQHYNVVDTLFSLDRITPNWQGISFNWKSSDPDDKSLYQIPLQFQHYLVKVPGDTLWAWSDTNWTDSKQVNIAGLESGSYILSAWCRDDAYTLSEAPATATFNVVKATLQHHILLIDETVNSGVYELKNDSTGNFNDTLDTFWENLLIDLEGELAYDNYTLDGVDVYFKDNSTPNAAALQACPIPYSLIGQYKLVLIYHDSHGPHLTQTEEYIGNRNQVLADYLDVGGRLWYEGRNVLGNAFKLSNTSLNTITTTSFLGEYMQLVQARPGKVPPPTSLQEFIGAEPTVAGFPSITVDSSHVSMVAWIGFPDSLRMIMPEVDWFTRSNEAVTLYTFKSVTLDTNFYSPSISNEDSPVANGATPVQCTIHPLHTPVMGVSQVANLTKGVTGQIDNFTASSIQVSYPFGQPWENTDLLAVDYRYSPVSEAQLKPVAMRYENQPRILQFTTINGIQVSYYTTSLGYRTSLFTFPLFFMKNDNNQIKQIATDMLNWFFYPGQHFNP